MLRINPQMRKRDRVNLLVLFLWCDRTGNWRLTDTEQAQAQVLQAAQNLLATGMEIEQVAQLLGLSEGQVKTLQSSS